MQQHQSRMYGLSVMETYRQNENIQQLLALKFKHKSQIQEQLPRKN